MGSNNSRPASGLINKEVLCEDGTYKTKTLALLDYHPGHSGYTGMGAQYCRYCRECHDTVACPYKWYYREV